MQSSPYLTQFSLSALMEMVTISAVLFALSGLIGTAASVCLILMAAALLARLGLLAVFMLGAASMLVNGGIADATWATGSSGLVIVYAVATVLCHWSRLRARRTTAREAEAVSQA